MTVTDDPTSSLFALLAKLDLTIGKQTDQLQQAAQRDASARRAVVPESQLVVASVVAPASGFKVMKIGGPTQGYRWNVRRWVIGGLTPTATAAGRGDVFVSAQPMDGLSLATQTLLQDWADTTSTLPAIAFYGEGEMPVKWPEQLWVMLTSAASAQTYVTSVLIQNVQDAASAQRLSV